MTIRDRSRLLAVASALLLGLAFTSAQQRGAGGVLGCIQAEGLERSHVLALFRTLTDEFGGRLTGSRAHLQAARWAADRFKEWKLDDARLEPFDFGRGWQLDRISAEMTEPRYVPLVAYADAWTPSTAGVIGGRAVYVGDKTAAQIQALAGELRGAIVLTQVPQTTFVERDRPQPGLDDRPAATGNPTLAQARSTTPVNEMMSLLERAGAGVALRPSAYRDGTVGVTGNRTTPSTAVPSVVVAGEQNNVLARLAAAGRPVALWSGEEQGLLGARAHVAQHFETPAARDRLAVYLNDDPGSGKTLGFYMQGNLAAKTIFDRWLEPMKALGATRNIVEGIGSTDHVPFNEAGMPGFNVIKDFAAYDARTRHTNADYPDRVSEEDLRQSAVVMATFAWQAATFEGRIPRMAPR